jgi:hypothetical protein
VLALTLAGAAGCGSSGGPRADLGRAVQRVGQLRAGNFQMGLTLAPVGARSPGGIGVRLSGSFALDHARQLPVMNVTYTRLAGTARTSATLISDGRNARLESGGRTIAVTGAQRQALAGVLQGPQGLGSLPLHVDRWISRPRSSPGPVVDGQPTERITGAVDIAGAAADLRQLSGGSGASGGQLDLAGTERRSSLDALVGRRDHVLHRLTLTAELSPTAGARAAVPVTGVDVALDLAFTPRPG